LMDANKDLIKICEEDLDQDQEKVDLSDFE
jgi:hypothetical protein